MFFFGVCPSANLDGVDARARDHVAAAVRKTRVHCAVMLNCVKSAAVTARLSMTVKLPYHRRKVGASTDRPVVICRLHARRHLQL